MKNWRRHSIFWPLVLISGGILLFANNLGQLPGTTWDAVVRLWPLLLIVAGLDGFWRGEGYAGATVVTGLGVIFLLGNLGYLSFTAWDLILRLWPVLLVAIGLDILLGRNRPWSAAVGVLVGLLVTAGILWIIMNAPLGASYKLEEVSLNMNDATRASGTISMPVGKLTLSSGATGSTLLEGALHLSGGETLNKGVSNSGSTATFTLESHGASGFVPFGTSSGQEEWGVKLNPAPSYTLDFKLAVGESQFDLTQLKMDGLSIQTAVGKTVILLPEAGSFNTTIQNAIGETIIRLPKGTPLRVRFERALTSTTQPADFTVDGRTVTSPGYTTSGGMDIVVSQAIGVIRVEYLP
jgi:hypothetical protein